MSHFTVMVVTKGGLDVAESEVERLLDPFDENRQVESYWTHEAESFEKWWDREYHVKEGNVPTDVTLDQLAAFLQKRDGCAYRQAADGSIERKTTYNPDSKWDWYQVGGRWRGALPIKPESDGAGVLGSRSWASPETEEPLTADQALIKDIDFAGARQKAVDHANARWEIVELIVAEHGAPKTIKEVAQAHGKDWEGKITQDERQPIREAYWAQPAIVAAKERGLLDGFFASWDESFGGHTRETYVESARLNAVCSYAFLSEETGWIAPGEMGWFGMSTDDRDGRLAYARKIESVLDALPEDAVVSIVDCHI